MLLDHWRVEVSWLTAASEGADATTWRSDGYDEALLFFAPGWRKFSAGRMRHLIVHELGHLIVRDLDRAVESLKDEIPGEAWNLHYERYLHEVEGIVDRYATILVGRS